MQDGESLQGVAVAVGVEGDAIFDGVASFDGVDTDAAGRVAALGEAAADLFRLGKCVIKNAGLT